MANILTGESKILMDLFRASDVPVCLVDPHPGDIMDINEAACRLGGFPREHYIGMKLKALWEDGASIAARMLEECNLRGETNFFAFYQTMSGERQEMQVQVLTLDRASRRRLLLIMKNITDERRYLRRLEASETRFQQLLNDIPSVSVQGYAADGTTIYWNKASERLYGYTQQEALGKSLLDLIIPPSMHRQVEDSIARMVQQNIPEPAAELQLMCKDGSLVDVFSSHALLRAPGEPPQLFCLDIDISQQKIARQLRLAASVFDHAAAPMLVTDEQMHILNVNHAFVTSFGYDPNALTGKTPLVICPDFDNSPCRQALREGLLETESWSGEMLNKRKDGTRFSNIVKITAVRDNDQQIANFIFSFTDLTFIKKQETALKRAAYYDALTGLPNRNLLYDRIRTLLRRRRDAKEQVAVLYIDLDGFKDVNDTFGHIVGDSFLRGVAQSMHRQLRQEDTLARLGGDEFVAVLDKITSRDNCIAVMERLLWGARQPINLQGHSLAVSASVGVAIFPTDATEPELLLRMADHAMYRAKSSGKNKYVFYDEKPKPPMGS